MGAEVTWFIDTNVILRYLLMDHPELSPIAEAFWQEVRDHRQTAALTEGVLMEAVYVLTKFYQVPRAIAVEKLKGLLRYAGLSQEPENLFAPALDLFARKTIDFVDCLLIVREEQGRGKLFSFDRKVSRRSPLL